MRVPLAPVQGEEGQGQSAADGLIKLEANTDQIYRTWSATLVHVACQCNEE